MNQISKKFFKYMLLGSIFVTMSCEVQENLNENNKRQILVEDFSLRSIQGKTSSKLLEVANKIKNLNMESKNSKTVYNATFDFYMDDEHGKHVVVDNKNSYTFEITRTTGDQKVENIVFEEKANGDFETFLVEYNFSREVFLNNPEPQINTDKSVTPINLETNTIGVRKDWCFEIYEDFIHIGYWRVLYIYPCGGGGGDLILADPHSGSGNYGGNNNSGNPSNSGQQNTGGGGITTTPVVNPNDPCLKMSKKLDPNEANLAPKILQIQALITPTGTGESGMNLVNVAGVPLTGPLVTTQVAEVILPFGPTKYGEMHTHPFDCYPMYSFTDIQRLTTILSTTAPTNINEVTTILTMPNDAGVMQTYAVTIGDVQGFTDAVNNAINSVDLPLFFTDAERIVKLNATLGKKYDKDNNYERVFLQFFADFNLNIYKANATLTKWNR